MTAVAIVGLGGMGARVATRLLAAGYQVIVGNRSAAGAAPLVKLGARAATTSAEAARQAGTLITMVAEVVVVGGHDGFDYAELRATTSALRNGARLFATGRDAVFPAPEGPRPGTGAVLAAVETAGGVQATVVGKPEPVMFEIACRALAGCERIWVIGDQLITDIAGAKRAGLGAILVLIGMTSRAELQAAVIPPDLVLETIAALPAALSRGQQA